MTTVTQHPERIKQNEKTTRKETSEQDIQKRTQNAKQKPAGETHARRLAHLVPCFAPIHGFRCADGFTTNRARGWVDRPQTISCGQCRGCRLERSRQWAVRMMHEAETSKASCFITLTYDQENLPVDHSLDKTHFQNFMKKLRKEEQRAAKKLKIPPPKVRYFHCGEYGEKNMRPHYHAALFGVDFRADGVRIFNKGQNKLYSSARLDRLWGKGTTSVGSLTFESSAYVARYIMKKVTGAQADDHYRWHSAEHGVAFERLPEYTTMSLKPGIGAAWIKKFQSDVYPSDEIIVNGKKTRPPKFYDAQLERIDPDLLMRVKQKRAKEGSKYEDNNTPDRHWVRDQLAKRREKKTPRQL